MITLIPVTWEKTDNIIPIINAVRKPGFNKSENGAWVSVKDVRMDSSSSAAFACPFINAGIAGLYDHQWNVDEGWRWMFGSGIIPSIVFILLLLRTPESPRWLAANDRWQEASVILAKVNGPAKAQEELDSIPRLHFLIY